MSSPMELSLAYATQQVNIYLRSILFVFGLVSNILNIVVFLSLQTFRESSCSFYLTAMSFINIIQMFVGLLSRTLSIGFGIDWSISSLAYCKLRYSLVQMCSLMSYTCIYLATIDQYLATCSNPNWRRFSNIKLARWLVGIFIIIWILHGIPVIYFYDQVTSDITNQTDCKITNAIFQQYYSYFYLLVLIGIIPVFITVLFGFLAYRNVQQLSYRAIPLVRRETDKQLTSMILVQDIFNLVFIIPYVIVYSLVLNRNMSHDRIYMAQVELASAITSALFYMSFCSGFYIYVCVSERFRRQFLYVLFKIHLRRWRQDFARNQILPQT